MYERVVAAVHYYCGVKGFVYILYLVHERLEYKKGCRKKKWKVESWHTTAVRNTDLNLARSIHLTQNKLTLVGAAAAAAPAPAPAAAAGAAVAAAAAAARSGHQQHQQAVRVGNIASANQNGRSRIRPTSTPDTQAARLSTECASRKKL